MTSIEETIRAYIAKEILFSDRYGYSDDASFLDEGIVDSMNVLQIVMFIEKKFAIRVEDEEVIPNNFDSVAKLANYVRSKMSSPVVLVQTAVTQTESGLRPSAAAAGQ